MMLKTLVLLAGMWGSLLSNAAAPAERVYNVSVEHPEQVVRHFGASDAWSMPFVGLWPKEQQEQIADWLFSTAVDANGQPRGIGLSLWRFNLGAGSAEQGDSAHINWQTRTECFRRADGSYDWDKQAGQRSFLRLAKERGVSHFLAFLNSMPVYFTKNGLGTNTGRGGTINLKDDCFGKAADFMADVIQGVERHDGIHFDYISPVNEPDGAWNWQGPKQEGSPATNAEIARLVRLMSKEFKKRRITTLITIPESSDLRCVWGPHDAGWMRGNEVETFFNPDSSATYLGSTYGVAPVMMAHGYWTDTPLESLKQTRIRMRDLMHRHHLAWWMSELCMMSNDKEIGTGALFDTSMRTALYVDRIIHHDLVYGNAESWQWWRALGSDYKDAFIRILSDDNWRTGKAIDSKLLWAVGNFSRFVRPGARRFDVTVSEGDRVLPDGATDPSGVMVSAYRNVDGRWVVVAINYAQGLRPIQLKVGGRVLHWNCYRTSDTQGENLKPVGEITASAVLEPLSVTTFVER